MFKKPYVDINEWREKPVRHRYVHGGFRETETRFSIYGLCPKCAKVDPAHGGMSGAHLNAGGPDGPTRWGN